MYKTFAKSKLGLVSKCYCVVWYLSDELRLRDVYPRNSQRDEMKVFSGQT